MTGEGRAPLLIDDDNLSRAWARTFLYIVDHPGTAISPLVVSITGFAADGEPHEDAGVRAALDGCLAATDTWDIDTVAWTIFPRSVWQVARDDRHQFYELYIDTYPRWRALNMRSNRRGLYFERLVNYGRGPMSGNQLEWIVTEYRSRPGVRRTMLQASVFDPERDHVPEAQLGFPCLQHVTFVPRGPWARGERVLRDPAGVR